MNLSLEVILVILIVFLFAFATLSYLMRGKKSTEDWRGIAREKARALNYVNVQDPIRLKNELINADVILDYCLQGKHVKGNTLGERLKNAKSLFNYSQYNKVWEAHKLRNQLVHEMESAVSPNQIRNSIGDLAQAIDNLVRS